MRTKNSYKCVTCGQYVTFKYADRHTYYNIDQISARSLKIAWYMFNISILCFSLGLLTYLIKLYIRSE